MGFSSRCINRGEAVVIDQEECLLCAQCSPYATNGLQCGCLCSGCDMHDYTTDEEDYPSCALEGCTNLGHFDPLTDTQERCCGLDHERTLAAMEEKTVSSGK